MKVVSCHTLWRSRVLKSARPLAYNEDEDD